MNMGNQLPLPLTKSFARRRGLPGIENRYRRWSRKPLPVLIKHFVRQILRSESLDLDDRQSGKLAFILAVFTCLGIVLGAFQGLQGKKFLFTTVMMTITGLFSVVSWDSIFLNARDYYNLLVLPVKQIHIYVAKLLSVLLVIGIISMTFGTVSTLFFTQFEAPRFGSGAGFFLFYWATLMLTNFLANLSIFLMVAMVQGIVLLLFRGGLHRKASFMLQVTLMLGMGSVFLWFPRIYNLHRSMEETISAWHNYFPPLWFYGFHRFLVDGNGGLYAQHFLLAAAAVIFPMLVYTACLPLSLKNFLKQPEGKRLHGFRFFRTVHKRMIKVFHRLCLADPSERGVFYFFIRMLKRNRKLKLRLAMFLVLPIGFAATYMIFLYIDMGLINLQRLNVPMIAYPFMLYFALVVGLRILVEHPASLGANWVFKMSCRQDIEPYLKGTKKAMYVYAFLPFSLVMMILYTSLWGIGPAFIHVVYSTLTGLLWYEAFFIGYTKIPFTSEYDPGAVDLKTTWFLFGIIFLLYYYIFIHLGLLLQLNPVMNVVFYIAASGILYWFKWQRNKYRKYEPLRLVFDADPEPGMLSLNLG